MQRIAVIAKLKPDAEKRGTDSSKVVRRSIPTSSESTVTRSTCPEARSSSCSQGGRLDHLLHAIVRDPANVSAFGRWEPLVEGFPTVAHEAYTWQRPNGSGGWGE
jgi:hypothetical protein